MIQPAPTTSDRIIFEKKRTAMLALLYRLFVDRWVPMTMHCRTDGKFTTTPQKGRVLEKLPEGKTSSIMS
jgi:hypothetical protein